MEMINQNGVEAVTESFRMLLNEAMKIEREQTPGEGLFPAVDFYTSALEFSQWLEENIPEGLSVFALPAGHRRRMRTTNMLERLHEAIKRRTRVARLFPNTDSLLRLVSATEMEISEEWSTGRRYLKMNVEMENENESADSKERRIYRKNVA